MVRLNQSSFVLYPQDLQKGIDLGLVSPEVLQNFFDLEQALLTLVLANTDHEALICADLQKGIDLGLVSLEVLQNFFDLEQYALEHI
ncbi:hypothetical protein RIF29_15858 [Crotalaria pallida]|uniref:Uncharacterized protein n=1 Tax=Crotalaria pallida TaxID=3830 RepID=A0AAN9FFH7_CROPI